MKSSLSILAVALISAGCGETRQSEQHRSYGPVSATGEPSLTVPTEEIRFKESASYRLFEADPKSGVCYRVPSFVRAGDYAVAMAKKRVGFNNDSPKTERRPFRLAKEKLQNVLSCADEALTSVAIRIAKLDRSKTTGEIEVSNLKWSPEIVVVDIKKYIEKAITPSSSFFEPILYDYYVRLRGNRFGKASGYIGCYLSGTDCQNLASKDIFGDYLRENFATAENNLGTDEKIATWFLANKNAQNMLNARLGGVAAGYKDLGVSYLGMIGTFAYPTAPHAAHNAYLHGDAVLKGAAVKINLDDLWVRFRDSSSTSISLDTEDKALIWKGSFAGALMRQAFNTTTAWLETPEGVQERAIFDKRLVEAQLQEVSLQQTNGLNETAVPPKNLSEVLDIVRWYSHVDNPLVEPLEEKVDFQSWKSAIKSVYRNEALYPGVLFAHDAQTELFVQENFGSALWTRNELLRAHEVLGIAKARSDNDNSIGQKRLAAVMSAYGRKLNTRFNFLARSIHTTPRLSSSKVGETLRLLLMKSARFGPGNATIFPAEQRIFVPTAGSFSFSTTFDLGGVDTDYNLSAITQGSERQATIIGRTAEGKYIVFMTLRPARARVPADANSEFDLSTWTRDLSVSVDSGRTWSGDSFIPPVFDNPLVKPNGPVPTILKPGFMSSEVQGSIASVPGFFGKGDPLVVHLHPQNSTSGIVLDARGNSRVEPCLGDSPGDASKIDTESDARCDYRMNLQIIAGRRQADFLTPGSTQKVGSDAVNWHFKNAFSVQSGSAGYSAISNLGRDDCTTANIGLVFEGSDQNTAEFRGFNNGITVKFIKIRGGNFSHIPQCAVNLDAESE